ncbi:MAG: aminotransferase class III-fold pyridoxal phosphate-dependent enzyme [Emcibacter sp.]|nr:aminotransferase class III-fold pyridoxal phosphate-dependent enzyme [Emcibacter sp.]
MTSVFYRGVTATYPKAAHSEGMYIFDDQGKKYLDMSGGAAVSCVGHQHPHVTDALCRQIKTMSFAHTAFFTNAPQEQLAAALAAKFGEADAKIYFTSGGSEANETAFKLAWQYWRAKGKPTKQKIISRIHSYHGNTYAALSISGNLPRRRVMGDILMDWPRIDPCYAYRHQRPGESAEEYGLRAANHLEDMIRQEGAETIAAFIAEPVVGASLGVVPAVVGYLKESAPYAMPMTFCSYPMKSCAARAAPGLFSPMSRKTFYRILSPWLRALPEAINLSPPPLPGPISMRLSSTAARDLITVIPMWAMPVPVRRDWRFLR